jgi:hypothetical protein
LREKGELPAPGLFESTARQFAEALHDLIDVRELTAIKYVTIQNEVNGEEPHGRRFKMDPEEYESIIRLFDTELKRIGLRDKVKLVGGDLVMREQELWVPFLGQHLGDVCDGWSMHAYWDYWDEEKIVRRLGGFAELIAALPAAQQKPLYATEFGIRGRDRNGEKNDPGDGENGSPIATTPLHGNQMARFVLESINRGYVAAVAWNMDDSLYDHAMKYGLMGTPKDGWPLKPAYHVMQLFTHATKPGWRAVKVEGAKEGVLVAAMAGSKNEVSVFVLNTRDQPNHVDINGLEGTFQLHTWNGNGKPSVREGDFFELGGKAGFGIPPFGMVVLSRR